MAAIEGVEAGQRGEVALGEVDHVDVVPDACAVPGRIVTAEHSNMGVPPDRYLHDVGHEVVGDSGGILADAAARVGADRVEIAQQNDPPSPFGGGDVTQH